MPDPKITPGSVLAGKYRVECLLGEGGHGIVVAAQHMTLNERVAIKLLREEVAQDTETVARFLREARASVRIKGEHVTRVLDVGELPNGMPYMVMEHLVGSDLATIVEAKGWLPISLAVDYVLQTCEALAEAHGLGIVHRDIKPSNLFLTTRPDGSPCIKVLDFGISKSNPATDGSTPDEMNLTQTQTVLGSPQYMAPEQMRSSKRVDGRTDIWAIGTTIHELLTGRPPFQAKTMPELFAMILQDPAPRLSDSRPEIPEQLELVVAKCLEKEADKRFSNVADLARALAPFASSTGIAVAERISRVGFNAAQSSRHSAMFQTGREGSSIKGLDLSQTEKTGSPFGKTRSVFLLATGGAFSVALAAVGIFFVVQAVRGRKPTPATPAATTTTTVLSDSTPSSSSSAPPATPPPSLASPPPPSASEQVSLTSASASAPVSPSLGKKRPPGPPGPKQHPPAASVTTAPTTAPPPALTPTETARPPGVASSRYD